MTHRQITNRIESMIEYKFSSLVTFRGPSAYRDYDKWLESNGIKKAQWSEGFREYFYVVTMESRVCIKNPMARFTEAAGHLLLVPMDFAMKAIVLGGLP